MAAIFIGYGFVIGILGAGLGLLSGGLVVHYINQIHAAMGRFLGIQMWNAQTYAFDTIPNTMNPREVGVICAVAVLSSVIGAVLPALRAARMNPGRGAAVRVAPLAGATAARGFAKKRGWEVSSLRSRKRLTRVGNPCYDAPPHDPDARTTPRHAAGRRSHRPRRWRPQDLSHGRCLRRSPQGRGPRRAPGEFLAIEGRSGSGKSTLLHLLGALDEPDAGSIRVQGRDLMEMGGKERSRVRNRACGFVFQFYHLLPELNVLENTLLAAMVQYSWIGFRSNRRELKSRAADLLSRLGLGHRLSHRPNQLSGGERQRVAIARALMNNPPLLLADEPTGNLDFDTGREIMAVLEGLHRDHGQTVVMVTHDRTLARTADRSMVLVEGKLDE